MSPSVARSRWAFLASCVLVLAVAVCSAYYGQYGLIPYTLGVMAGAVTSHLFTRYAMTARTFEVLEDVESILHDTLKSKGRLDRDDPEYALANGIVHGLRAFNLVADPQLPTSEFQSICLSLEKEYAVVEKPPQA